MRAAVVALPRGAGEGFEETIPSAEVDGAVISCWHLMAALMLLCRQIEFCPASQCLQTTGGLQWCQGLETAWLMSRASFLEVHGVRTGWWLSGAPVLLTL